MEKIISVIIPCYNVGKYLPRLFHSLIHQTIGWDSLEVIFVNDASTDDTLEVLTEFEKEYQENVILVKLTQHEGVSNARNIAYQYTTCPYISYLDSDDWIEWDMYEKMFQKSVEYDCDMVLCRCDRPKSEMDIRQGWTGAKDVYYKPENEVQQKKTVNILRGSMSCCDKLYKKVFLDSINVQFPVGLHYEDQYWSFLVLLSAKSIYRLEEYLYHWFVNPFGITRGRATNPFDRVDIHMLLADECKKRGLYHVFKEEIDYNEYEMLFVETLDGYLRKLDLRSVNEDDVKQVNNLKNILFNEIPDIKENPYYNYKHEKSQIRNELLFKLLLDNEVTTPLLSEFLRFHIRIRER